MKFQTPQKNSKKPTCPLAPRKRRRCSKRAKCASRLIRQWRQQTPHVTEVFDAAVKDARGDTKQLNPMLAEYLATGDMKFGNQPVQEAAMPADVHEGLALLECTKQRLLVMLDEHQRKVNELLDEIEFINE